MTVMDSRPAQKWYGPDDFSYSIRSCPEARPHYPHRHADSEDTWVCFGMDSGGHRPSRIMTQDLGWGAVIMPDNRPQRGETEEDWRQLRLAIIRMGFVNAHDASMGLLIRALIEQFRDRERRIEVLKDRLRWAELKLTPHPPLIHEYGEEDRCHQWVTTTESEGTCGYPADSPVHTLPNRLGLPESQQKVVDLPDLPDAFIMAFLAALDRFAEGYAEYGPGAADPLGLAGQWGDLHRKVMKLKRAFWSGEKDYLTRESEEAVLQDIIGHSLLALEMLTRGFEGGR